MKNRLSSVNGRRFRGGVIRSIEDICARNNKKQGYSTPCVGALNILELEKCENEERGRSLSEKFWSARLPVVVDDAAAFAAQRLVPFGVEGTVGDDGGDFVEVADAHEGRLAKFSVVDYEILLIGAFDHQVTDGRPLVG